MGDTDIPEYFLCPITLQIMNDPVTAITGITYDRESIEHWLFTAKKEICPVSKQPLPRNSDLTPNHTLRRLIQAWCAENEWRSDVHRIPTPKSLLSKSCVLNLLKELCKPNLQLKALRQLELLAVENERNHKCMLEAGVPDAILTFVLTCFERGQIDGLGEALSLLHLIKLHSECQLPIRPTNLIRTENDHIFDAFMWVLSCEMENCVVIKSHAILVLKTIVQSTKTSNLERLKPEFFQRIVRVLRNGINQQGIKAALQIMLVACPWGRNRIAMVEAGAVFELIELELSIPEKQTTELIFGVLYHLCLTSIGRSEFINHKGGIAVLSKRILRVSSTVDDRTILILSLLCKFSGTHEVLQEMLKVGAVSKLCTVLQMTNRNAYLKDNARVILRSHYEVWKSSPCIGDSIYPV